MRKSTPFVVSALNTSCAAAVMRPRSSSVEPEMSAIQMKSATGARPATNGLQAFERRALARASAVPFVRSARKVAAGEATESNVVRSRTTSTTSTRASAGRTRICHCATYALVAIAGAIAVGRPVNDGGARPVVAARSALRTSAVLRLLAEIS
jgi:hypothetical protein